MPKINPTIYWVCPRPAAPSGGVWFIHRLAELCDRAGIAARVARLSDQDFTVWWDAHPLDEARLPLWLGQSGEAGYPWTVGDTVIVPEVMWPLPELRGARQIMFMQNYKWLDDAKREQLKAHPETEILVCSRFLYNWCVRELGVRPIGIVTPFLDEDVWAPTPKTSNVTVLYARQNKDMAERLSAAIQAAGFPLEVIIGDYSQRELRSWFDRAEFYVHHLEPEGFPMAALEAMRCGVIPVGTSGGGGNEFMFNEETALVTPGPLLGHYTDPQQFVDKVVGMLTRLRSDATLREKLWTNGYSWSKRYTAAATTDQLVKLFGHA